MYEKVHRAGKKAYDAFFSLYAFAVYEGRIQDFVPLGYIPGPAVVWEKSESGIRVLDATPDIIARIGKIPTKWMNWGEIPYFVLTGWQEWTDIFQALGKEPSPWNLPVVGEFLRGKSMREPLAIGMPRFIYQPGDSEVPFGVLLTPEEEGVRIKIYNPKNLPCCYVEDSVLSFEELKESQTVQKLLKVWAKMENSFLERFLPDGRPRP